MGCIFGAPAPPDYSDPKCWQHIHGKVNGGGDHVPNGVASPSGDPECDLFFVHGTNILIGGNAGWDSDAAEADQTKVNLMRVQASFANNVCRVYAPKYRQVSIATWMKQVMLGSQSKKNFDIVKEDMDAAFDEFLKTYCTNGRPFVLSGHSQGGYCIRYLVGKVDKDPELRKRLVCAYIAGCRVSADSYTNIPPAEGEVDCGCWVSWSTTAADTIPVSNANDMKNEVSVPLMVGGERFGTGSHISHNPLSWTLTDEEAPASEHLGCLTANGQMTDMKVSCRSTNKDSKEGNISTGLGGRGGVLLIKGSVPDGYTDISSGNLWDYHMGDIPIFWMNLRVNVEKRLEAWKTAQKE